MKRLLAAFALAALPAHAFDEAKLMQLLAATTEVAKPYTEKKFSPLLLGSVDSSGTLLYRKGEALEKQVAMPRAERYRILADAVSVERGGKEQRITFASRPALAALAASLRGVLSGDVAELRKYFALAVGGSEAAWTLELTPKDEALRAHVERVRVAGRAGIVTRIETFEANGDRTLMEIP